MMKLIHIVVHNPIVSLLVIVAALFVFSLILSDLQGRRLKRELLAARLRARTLYQHRRLQNEQMTEEPAGMA